MNRIEQLCADKGMRMTDQRRVVARVLGQATDHPDVEELYRRAHAVDPALHRILAEQVPRIGRMGHVRDVERRFAVLVRGYLEGRRAELRPRDLELASLLAVQTAAGLLVECGRAVGVFGHGVSEQL